MIIDILTLFPEMFVGPFDMSMLKKAKDLGLVKINIHNLRDWAVDKHKSVDDRPYGGGKGMILRVDIIDSAITSLKSKDSKVILLSPQGKVFDQENALKLSGKKHLILICGHYEGVDQRVVDHLVDEEISIGEYVLTGGELPAMIITDTIVRLIPGVLDPEATSQESFSLKIDTSKNEKLIEYPQYTRPPSFKGWDVPIVLQSGNHGEIKAWKEKMSVRKS